MVYTERAEMAAVSRGTGHVSAVSTPPWWIFKNTQKHATKSPTAITTSFLYKEALTQHLPQESRLAEEFWSSKEDLVQTTTFINTVKLQT